MLETIFYILLLAAGIVLIWFVFKTILKVALIILIILILIVSGRYLFGDDWLTDKIKTDPKPSNSSVI